MLGGSRKREALKLSITASLSLGGTERHLVAGNCAAPGTAANSRYRLRPLATCPEGGQVLHPRYWYGGRDGY